MWIAQLVSIAALFSGAVALGDDSDSAGAPPEGPYAEIEARVEQNLAQGRVTVLRLAEPGCAFAARFDADMAAAPRVQAFLRRHGVDWLALEVDPNEVPGSIWPTAPSSAPSACISAGVGMMLWHVNLSEPVDGEVMLEHLRKVEYSGRLFRRNADPESEALIEERWRRGRELTRRGEWEEASDDLLWLWENMGLLRPSMEGVRNSFLASELWTLARRYPPAHAALAELRDALVEPMNDGGANFATVQDWVQLHRILGDDEGLLAWVEQVFDTPRDRWMLDRGDRSEIEGVLFEHRRWGGFLALYPEPVGSLTEALCKATRRVPLPEDTEEDLQSSLRALNLDSARRLGARLHAAFLALERDGEAREIAGLLLGAEESPYSLLALVDAALAAGRRLPEHVQWLDQVDASSPPRVVARRSARLRAQLVELPE